MAKEFNDLMAALDEVDTFLAGDAAGYKISSSAESDSTNAEGQLVEEVASTIGEKFRPQRH